MGTAASSSTGGRSKVKPLAAGTRAVSAPVRRASAVEGGLVSVEDVDDGERGAGGSDLTVTRTRSIKSASAASRLQGTSPNSSNDTSAADACAKCAKFEAALSAAETNLAQVREELDATQARADQAEAKLLQQESGAERPLEGPGATLLAPAKLGPRPGLLPGLDRAKQLQDQLTSHKEQELKECRERAKVQQAQLEKRMARLKSKLKKAKAESSAQVMELQERIAELEKENSALRVPTKVPSEGVDGSDIDGSVSEENAACSAQTNLILNLSSHIEELDEELQAARQRIAELEAAT